MPSARALAGRPPRAAASPERTRPVEDRVDGFVELYHECFESVHRYLNRMAGDPDLAADLAQETFVRLHRRRDLPDDPKAWLFTVATNLFRNAKNKRRNRALLLTFRRGLQVHSDPLPAPDADVGASDTKRRVRGALDGLKERDRSLLLLAAEAYSYREMSKILGLREASVGTLLRRAKQAFRAAYEEDSNAP